MREKLLNILTEICPAVDFNKEKALIDDGLVDSFDIVAIVSELMDAFAVEINVENLTPENFNEASDAILRLLEEVGAER